MTKPRRPRGTGSIVKQKRKDGRETWQVRYYDAGSRQRKKGGFPTKALAERYLKHVLADVDRGEHLDPARGKRPLKVFAKAWLEVKDAEVKPKTVEGYRSNLKEYVLPAFGDHPVASIHPRDVELFVAELKRQGVSQATIRNVVIKVLKPILNRAVTDGAIKASPAATLKLAKARGREEMRFLTAEQVAALAAAMPEPYGVLIYFLAYTGLRWGEATGLRRRRVDLLHGRVEVAETANDFKGEVTFGPPKTEASERTVSLPRFLVRMLDEYLREHAGGPGDLVFTAEQGGPLRNANFRNRVFRPTVRGRPAAGKSGALPDDLHDLRIHDLRHTCVALLVGQGAHALEIRHRLGHESITVTLDTYGHLLPSLEERIVSGLDATYEAALPPNTKGAAEMA